MKQKTSKAVVRRNTSVARVNNAIVRGKQSSATYYLPENEKGENMLLTTLAVGAAGVLGYFGWEYLKKKKVPGSYTPNSSSYLPSIDTAYNNGSTNTDTITNTTKKKKHKQSSDDSSSYTSDSNSDFPLKRGSKGDKVRRMQQALIDKYGNGILPKYGADGDFGSETAKALKKEGLLSTISQSTYNVIVNGGGGSNSDSTAIAEGLYTAAENGDFTSALNLLKKIVNKEDYEEVSKSFEDHRIGGVRQTLVNGMMDSFSSEEQKQQIRFEFLRMGLQYDGNKWSLSGFDGLSLITRVATTVWINGTKTVKVPAKMVLGNEIGKRLDFTLFENNGKYFLVKTAAVKHL